MKKDGKEKKDGIEKWISTGSEITGASMGGLIGLTVAGPAGAILAGAGGVVITKILEKLGI